MGYFTVGRYQTKKCATDLIRELKKIRGHKLKKIRRKSGWSVLMAYIERPTDARQRKTIKTLKKYNRCKVRKR